MTRPTKAQLVDQLLEVHGALDEVTAILTDEGLSEPEKLKALEDLLLDDGEDGVEEEDDET